MGLEVAGLVLLSALLHPLWNAVLKKGGEPESGFLVLTLLLTVFAAGHTLLGGNSFADILPVWPLVLVSWSGQLLYGFCLVATLRRGDLSAYYPIIRSSPAAVVLIGFLFLGQQYGAILLAGIALILLGGFLLQYQRGVNLLGDPRTLGFAVLAMCGTAIYSLSDSRAVREVPPPVMFFWVEILCLASYLVLFRYIGQHPVRWTTLFTWLKRPARYGIAGIMCYASYWLILKAYSVGGDVAAVTSVRQASIPLSVLIGGILLQEGAMGRRLFASLLLAAGVVVVVLA